MRKYALEYVPESDAAYVRLFEHKDDRIKETVEFDEGMQAELWIEKEMLLELRYCISPRGQ